MKPLYKTTIVVWTDTHPGDADIKDLALEATSGNAYCSKQDTELVSSPEKDPDWDGTEFFFDDDDDEDEES